MDSNKFLIIDNLRKAHEAACNAYNFMTEASDHLKDAVDVFNEETETKFEELTGLADELQAALFDLLEDAENE